MDQGRYDIIIIGSGAGGGTLAYRLASSGARILLLERGDYVPREKDNWSTRAVNVQGKYAAKESCGVCTPCRETAGLGADDPDNTIPFLDVMEQASLCAFGRRVPPAVRSLRQAMGIP